MKLLMLETSLGEDTQTPSHYELLFWKGLCCFLLNISCDISKKTQTLQKHLAFIFQPIRALTTLCWSPDSQSDIQPSSQPTNQPTNQPPNQPTKQPNNCPNNQITNQPTNHSSQCAETNWQKERTSRLKPTKHKLRGDSRIILLWSKSCSTLNKCLCLKNTQQLKVTLDLWDTETQQQPNLSQWKETETGCHKHTEADPGRCHSSLGK